MPLWRCVLPVILIALLVTPLGRAQTVGGADYAPQYDFSEFWAATDGRRFQVVVAGNPFPALPADEVMHRLLPVMQANKPRPNLTFTYETPPEEVQPSYRLVLVYDPANDLTAARVCAGVRPAYTGAVGVSSVNRIQSRCAWASAMLSRTVASTSFPDPLANTGEAVLPCAATFWTGGESSELVGIGANGLDAATEPDAVYELGFRAKSAFSCALEDGRGQVVHKKTRVRECELLVRPQTERFKVRLWTTDGTTQVQESLHSKPVRAGGRGTLPAAQASLVTIPRAGRYATAPQVYCLGGEARGLLRPCGPQTSLPAGPTVFATYGAKDLQLPLDEQLVTAGVATTLPLTLSAQPWLQGLTAAKSTVFLLTAEVPHGERAAPACAFETGVRESHERACFAASNVGTAAIARAWAPTPGAAAPIGAQLTHRAVVLPAQATDLQLGRTRLALASQGSLFTLPGNQRARLELTLPGDAWAVLLDDGGRAPHIGRKLGGILIETVTVGRHRMCVRCREAGRPLSTFPQGT